jgi:hypothetical protein
MLRIPQANKMNELQDSSATLLKRVLTFYKSEIADGELLNILFPE